jgi:hypothetical protein
VLEPLEFVGNINWITVVLVDWSSIGVCFASAVDRESVLLVVVLRCSLFIVVCVLFCFLVGIAFSNLFLFLPCLGVKF